MNRWSGLALLLIIAAALALRIPRLATRPLHNDEAVNAVKVSDLWQHGHYAYDPDEYHGPTLHYATLPALWLSGARNPDEVGDATLRVAPVVFGIGLILVLLLLVDGLGRSALLWAALFTAVSPAMVFYSRYFIHEMLLVFFGALVLGAGWRYTQTRSAVWALMAGAGAGLMFATKETFVLSLAAMGLAGVGTLWWTAPKGTGIRTILGVWNWKHALLAMVGAAAVWVLLFSSFFTNPAGLPDSIRTYLPWLKRAGGHSPHIHSWTFYLERLAWFHSGKGPYWSEGLILGLAVVGGVVALAGKPSPLRRFLALYTLLLTGIYCVISYKTPWCLLGFFQGMILLAGIGAAALVESCRRRWLKVGTTALLLALTGQLSCQAWRASFVYAADRRNPYVYSQTAPDLVQLVQRVEALGKVAPAGYETIIKVVAPGSDYWPLPWYLRRFKNVGWYEKLPEEPYAPIVLVSSKLDARLDDRSERRWIMAGITQLRPGKFLELYVELELWKKYVETLPKDRD